MFERNTANSSVEKPDKEKAIKARKPKTVAKSSQIVCLQDAFVCLSDSCYETEKLFYQDFLDKHYYGQGFIYVRKN